MEIFPEAVLVLFVNPGLRGELVPSSKSLLEEMVPSWVVFSGQRNTYTDPMRVEEEVEEGKIEYMYIINN